MERAPRPGWHGIPPSTDRYVPPLSLPAPTSGITETSSKAPPLWVDLIYTDGSKQTVKAFAMAWTNSLVRVQWVEFSIAREAWVDAGAVRRRQIEERQRHRDG
ncbi:hypothetical protein FJV46_10775 [Arthrobacter agilis]|uniref:hypothetical protein n=1 Tax=Arthrobacter agilis TaxID=37921 RepID=UPI000F7E0881|nr:hypothetical protein [Arthrobacter agilis]TPV23828.1 hypothetical protein FJV46_10775 [Arthrobacter agilis]